ncbi:MAG TPA: hypothetical protein VNM90_20435 [Haliangium sp.]|nr:hypothetical protein [Haliangium sp.]
MLKLNRFPLSRCLFVLEQCRDRARALDIPAIVTLSERAAARVREALDVDQRQRALRTSKFPPEAHALDQLVDAAIDGLDSYCESQMALFRSHERGAAAARLRRALLPEGVGEIKQLPYADQHTRIAALLARAEAPDVIADLALLPDITIMLGRVRELNTEYGERLRDSEETLTRQDVRARHQECQELLYTLACLIIGHFGALPEHHADRDRLLEPILRENDALRERRRRRRANENTDDDGTDDIPEPDDDAPPSL